MALWIFGYGSLLWNPGFTPVESKLAVLHDYHRSFCMLSVHHRGSHEDPGLVLALDEAAGATCTGMALRAADEEADAVLEMLRERELISSAYFESTVGLKPKDGTEIEALAYIIDPEHEQYCQFPLEKQAQIIARAIGGRGPNTEYLASTAEKLRSLDIRDDDIRWLDQRVREIRSAEM